MRNAMISWRVLAVTLAAVVGAGCQSQDGDTAPGAVGLELGGASLESVISVAMTTVLDRSRVLKAVQDEASPVQVIFNEGLLRREIGQGGQLSLSAELDGIARAFQRARPEGVAVERWKVGSRDIRCGEPDRFTCTGPANTVFIRPSGYRVNLNGSVRLSVFIDWTMDSGKIATNSHEMTFEISRIGTVTLLTHELVTFF